APAASPVVADPVLRLVGEIGVGGAELLPHLVVGARAGVRVAHEHRYRGPRRPALEDPREDLDQVLLLPGRHNVALTGLPAVQVRLDVPLRKREPGGAAVYDDPHGGAVAFAPCGDPEEVSEGVGHRSLAGTLGRQTCPASGKSCIPRQHSPVDAVIT